jgi:hypothetical protein
MITNLHRFLRFGAYSAAALMVVIVMMAGCMPLTSEAFESVCRDRLLEAALAEDLYSSQNGRFGTFSELTDSGRIKAGKTLDTMAGGYEWDLSLNEDKSRYRILAVPSQDPSLTSYLIDGAKTVMVLREEPVTDPGTLWKAFMNAEDMAWAEDHHYVFPDLPEYRDVAMRLDIQVSEEGLTYTLSNPGGIKAQESQGDLGSEYLYYSETKKFYKVEPIQ